MKSKTLKKDDGVILKDNSVGKALVGSTRSLRKAGELLLEAVETLPESNASLTAAADALIRAHSALISAVQLLADAGDMPVARNKLIPPASERLKALEYTLN